MQNPVVTVLFAGADKDRASVDAVLTNIRVLSRMFKGPSGEKVEIRLQEIDAPDFHLDGETIRNYVESRAILVLLVTPCLMTDELITASTALVASTKDGLTVYPIYCLPVPGLEELPLTRLAWYPSNYRDRPLQAISDLGNVDSSATTAAQHLKQLLKSRCEQSEPAATSTPAATAVTPAPAATSATTPQPQPARSARRDTALTPGAGAVAPNAPTSAARSIADRKIPAIGVYCARQDANIVKDKLGPTLTVLRDRRNARAYADFLVEPGADIQLRRNLGLSARHLVICLSAASLAEDELFKLMANIRIDQQVTFVLLSACLWRVLKLDGLQKTMLPQAEGRVVTMDQTANNDGWNQVGDHLLSLFPTSLPAEDDSVLTPREQVIAARRTEQVEAQRQRYRPVPMTDAELVRAYYNK